MKEKGKQEEQIPGIRRHRVSCLCGKSAGFVWRVRGTESRGFRNPGTHMVERERGVLPLNLLRGENRNAYSCIFPLFVCVCPCGRVCVYMWDRTCHLVSRVP